MPNSRISGACNGCRAKKQKCSGDRVVSSTQSTTNGRAGTSNGVTSVGCYQCEAAGVICTWPEQRKRGPAKGYIEGLEHRLHEAERLLLRLLEIIDDERLGIAVDETMVVDEQGTSTSQHGESQEAENGKTSTRKASPPILNKKTGVDYWENFPLDSLDNVRRWQGDCISQHNFLSSSKTTRGAPSIHNDTFPRLHEGNESQKLSRNAPSSRGPEADNDIDDSDDNQPPNAHDEDNSDGPDQSIKTLTSPSRSRLTKSTQSISKSISDPASTWQPPPPPPPPPAPISHIHHLNQSFTSRQQAAANRIMKSSSLGGSSNTSASRTIKSPTRRGVKRTNSSDQRLAKGGGLDDDGRIIGDARNEHTISSAAAQQGTLTDEMERDLFW